LIPLALIPFLALFYFDSANFAVDSAIGTLSLSHILSRVTLLTLWGFIGVESATAPAGSVENPSKTIPRAIVAGTACVALMYLVNSFAIMGIIPSAQLMGSSAPYADATRIIFGGNWYLIISIIASVICMGTLNAWILTSSQIALGLAQDGLMPPLFMKKNKFDAPFWSLIISGICIIPLLILTANQSLASQVLTIIDFSVTSFLFVYALSCLAFFKILLQRKEALSEKIGSFIYGIVALLFCCWVIYETPLNTILIASLFTLSGVLPYIYFHSKRGKLA